MNYGASQNKEKGSRRTFSGDACVPDAPRLRIGPGLSGRALLGNQLLEKRHHDIIDSFGCGGYRRGLRRLLQS